MTLEWQPRVPNLDGRRIEQACQEFRELTALLFRELSVLPQGQGCALVDGNQDSDEEHSVER